MTDVVYLMRCQGIFKIGFAKTLLQRFNSIQTGCPFTVRLLAVIEGATYDTESFWHEQFKAKRMHGEWFELDANDVALFLEDATVKWADGISSHGHDAAEALRELAKSRLKNLKGAPC